MPLHYSLTEVYSKSNKKLEVIQEMIITFLIDTERASYQIRAGIKSKKHKKVLKNAELIADSVDLFGLDTAYENLTYIIKWAKLEGKKKEIRATYKEFRKQLEAAHRELQKDYNLMDYIKEL